MTLPAGHTRLGMGGQGREGEGLGILRDRDRGGGQISVLHWEGALVPAAGIGEKRWLKEELGTEAKLAMAFILQLKKNGAICPSLNFLNQIVLQLPQV